MSRGVFSIQSKSVKTDEMKLAFISSRQLGAKRYLAIQHNEPIRYERVIHSEKYISAKDLLYVNPSTDLEYGIKQFLANKLRTRLIIKLGIGFGLLISMQKLKSSQSIEILNEFLSIIQIALMVYTCILGYRIVRTASMVEIIIEEVSPSDITFHRSKQTTKGHL